MPHVKKDIRYEIKKTHQGKNDLNPTNEFIEMDQWIYTGSRYC